MMRTEYIDGAVKITGEDIRPEIVFDCGQCFRFNPDENGGYTGVAHGRVLNVKTEDGALLLCPSTKEDFENIWTKYFDLDLSYADMEEKLKKDEVLAKTIDCSRGMRLLVQEPFETLISFIISANNNIGRIKGIIERICALCGDKIECGGERYAFPTPEQLSELTEEQLTLCGAGYRAPYIKETSTAVASGEFDMDELYELEYGEAKKKLLTLKGVGPKVADCILLFAYDKKNAFPVDVWMKRVLVGMYGFSPKNTAQAEEFAREHFGKYAGIAQQYLFNYARINRII